MTPLDIFLSARDIYRENYRLFLLAGIGCGGIAGCWTAFSKNKGRDEDIEVNTGLVRLLGKVHLTLVYIASGMALGGCVFGTLPSTLPCLALYSVLDFVVNRGRCSSRPKK
jgi:hypothetical protein